MECEFMKNNFVNKKTEEENHAIQKFEEKDLLPNNSKELRVFSSKKWCTCVYSLVILMTVTQSSYFFGALSTIEKKFEMTATRLGILKSTFEVGKITTNIFLSYFIGKGNKIRWISSALLLNGIMCLVRITPHFTEFSDEPPQRENISEKLNETCDEFRGNINSYQFAFYVFIAGQVITAMCGMILTTSGYVYLDFNTRKNVFPLLMSVVAGVGHLGTSLGYVISFYALKIYVYPSETPNFTNKNYQWIGAWWLGWIPISFVCFILSIIVTTIPQTLPRAELHKKNSQRNGNSHVSVADFYASLKRILRNRLVVLDILGQITEEIALSGYEVFLPKYLEAQYGLSSSKSSLFLAILKIFEKPCGNLMAGLGVHKFKPKPRLLMKFNLITKFLRISVIASFIFIACPQEKIQGNWMDDNRLNLTTECNIDSFCPENSKYSPVCGEKHKLYFYSSCHAGCSPMSTNLHNEDTYSNCSCVPDFASVTKGLCPVDCKSAVLVFLFVNAIFNAFIFPIRFTRIFLRFRFVDDEDQSLHYGIRKFIPNTFGLLSSIIYGYIIDKSCLIFEKTCHGDGHCLMYNLTKWRYLINSFAIGFLSINAIIEIFMWYFVKNLKMYDEDFKSDSFTENESDEKLVQK